MDDTTRDVSSGGEFRGRGDESVRNREAADTGLDPETARRASRIEGEIANTRAEMSETIDAIQDRLRPGNLVSDATEKVKAVTTRKVKDMADTASETAQGMMRETREQAYGVVEGARQNPIPALMIGAGVAWMLMDRRNPRGSQREQLEWSDYRSGAYGERERSLHRSEGLSSWTREAGDEARRKARQTQNGLQRMMRQNPLLVGAAAMLAGAAIGASLPETERENELMGETRDTVVDKAQEVAREAAGAVREAAGDAVGETVGKVAKTVAKGTTSPETSPRTRR